MILVQNLILGYDASHMYILYLSHYSLNEYVLHDSNHGYLLELAKHPRTYLTHCHT